MNYFKRLDLSIGWLVFLITGIVYTLSVEPSASLWDCSEFIATSYKMEVGHPPGAPLFMMINRFFTIFAPGTQYVALMVNMVSVLASAFTVLFLFWTISHLGRRIFNKTKEELTKGQIWAIMGAAAIGSLAYAFTDTFWFSAIEGEVYAQSSLFTALVFWGILKWENEADKPYGNRWLILLAYLMGLSIGVHLLNLLAIPSLVLVFYYRKFPQKSKKGWWKAFGVSILILGGVLYGIIPHSVSLGAWFDRIFVNGFGAPVNFGFAFFFVMLLAVLGFFIYRTHKRGKAVANTILLCVAMMLVGYGTYASVVIRSVANPPMNSNQPSDPYSLLSFLNRDQYGNRPLFRGQYYSSPAIDADRKTTYYYDSVTERYLPQEVLDYSSIKYAPGTTTVFPRMYEERNEAGYKSWVDIKGKKVRYRGETYTIPTFGENLEFFFKYQVNYMYWRYFMWNFVGRQNDLQGDGSILKGNWISGIPFIDALYLGPQDKLPTELKENKGRNTYFFLPFLLGMAGLFFQLSRDRNNFNVVMFLFLMTGLAIILYLNQPPNQPRERDYAYAGSFYAFSIWIGLGVLWVYHMLQKVAIGSDKAKAALATAVSLVVPVILLAQNWDDHTRARRYVARDYGANYLESTLPNAIILPYGDNDTFPLWYNQEVEGVRPDVKVANTSYLQGDWYVAQMEEKTNQAEGIDFTIPRRVYFKDNDYMEIVPLWKDYVPIQTVLEFIANDGKQKQEILDQIPRMTTEIFPANKIAIPVNKENAVRSGIVREEDLDQVVDTIYIELKGRTIDRGKYMTLDMIGTADWSRPIYFTQPYITLRELGLTEYLQQDGMAYRLVPIRTPGTPGGDLGRIDSDYLYNKLMNTFRYGNLQDTTVNADVFVRNTVLSTQLYTTAHRLANRLLDEGDTLRAREVLTHILKEIPPKQIGVDYAFPELVLALYNSGMEEEGKALLEFTKKNGIKYMDYFASLSPAEVRAISRKMEEQLYIIYNLYMIGKAVGHPELVEELKTYTEMVQ